MKTFFVSFSGWCSTPGCRHLNLSNIPASLWYKPHHWPLSTRTPVAVSNHYVLANSATATSLKTTAPLSILILLHCSSSPLLMWWFLVVAPATHLLAWWAACTSSIMAAQAQSEIFTRLPPLLASHRLERTQRGAVCPCTLYLVEGAGLIVTSSASQGLCRVELEWMALSALKMCSQRLSMIKRLSRVHWELHQLLWQGLHQSCWSALCAYCVSHGRASQTSWPVIIVPVLIVCDSICASRSQSRVNISCPECSERFNPHDIQMILGDRALMEKYEEFMLRRWLVAEPDCRWCPAPDCG